MVLSFGWTASDGRTMAELARVLGYAGIAVLALASLNRDTFRAAAAGLSLAALGIAAIAVASRLAPGTFPAATEVASQFRTDRLDFPLDYWNAVGAWGAMSMAIGLAWSAHARFALTRALALASVPVAALAVYLSYSRGGVVGTATALVAVLALSRNRWTAFAHAIAAGAGAGVAILVVRSNPQIADATGQRRSRGGRARPRRRGGALRGRRLHDLDREGRRGAAACAAGALGGPRVRRRPA